MKYRSQLFACVLAVLSCTTYVQPLTESSSLLENKSTGKRVLLLADVHDQSIKEEIIKSFKNENKTFSAITFALFDAIKSQQQKELIVFVDTIIADINKQQGQTIIVSEIDNNYFKRLFKKNVSDIQTIWILPYVIINHLSKSAIEEELDIQKFMSPLDVGNKNFFQITDKVHFIAGDYFRSASLDDLLRYIYYAAKNDEDLSSLKEKLPAHLTQITIATLKEDLIETSYFFEKFGIKTTNNEQLLVDINTLPESTLIIDAVIQLQQNDLKALMATNEALHQFQCNKCDCELSYYVTAVEVSSPIQQMIINAGAKHIDFIKDRLINNGFQIIEESDTQGCLDFEAKSSQELVTLTEKALTTLQQKSPHELLPKLFQA